jgi:hypothetical protein
MYDEGEEIDIEQKILRSMMENSYPDAEIDKLLETFGGSSSAFKMNINTINGEYYIENDIRFSEAVRDAIDEIKHMQRQGPPTKTAEAERRRFLSRQMEIAETLDVSLTVEHLLPALNEIVPPKTSQILWCLTLLSVVQAGLERKP